jgi:prepilin-type N-terminal cleavage/methylation domain-containing protein
MNTQKGFTLIELITVIGLLSLIGGIGYVVIHFISKFW